MAREILLGVPSVRSQGPAEYDLALWGEFDLVSGCKKLGLHCSGHSVGSNTDRDGVLWVDGSVWARAFAPEVRTFVVNAGIGSVEKLHHLSLIHI